MWEGEKMDREQTVNLRQAKQLQVERLYHGGMSIAQCCKTVGISVHTYYKWCSREHMSTPDALEQPGCLLEGEH